MASKLKLKPEDYARIDHAVGLKGDEVYGVVTHRHRGQIIRSIHVFTRMPNEQELQKYETKSSNVEFKGRKASVKTRSVEASGELYDVLIDRAYDVPVGTRVLGELVLPGEKPVFSPAPVEATEPGDGRGGIALAPKASEQGLNRDQAIKKVDAVTKRLAIGEIVGQTWGASKFDEDDEEDGDEQDADSKS